MNFEFSDRYEPLFDLLNTWKELERLEQIAKPTKQDKQDLERI